MSDCPFGTFDWYCVLQAGHDGPHQSDVLTFYDRGALPPPLTPRLDDLEERAPMRATSEPAACPTGNTRDWMLGMTTQARLKATGLLGFDRMLDMEEHGRLRDSCEVRHASLTYDGDSDEYLIEFGFDATVPPGFGGGVTQSAPTALSTLTSILSTARFRVGSPDDNDAKLLGLAIEFDRLGVTTDDD